MSRPQLRLAAQLCSSSYYEEVSPPWAVDVLAVHEGTDDAILIEGVDSVWVVFRGTEWSMAEWAHNFQISKEDTNGYGKVHGGFLTHMTALWRQLNQHPAFADKKINLCGHSRGGSLSQLAALAHREIFGSSPNVFTFGSPRVGNPDFVKAYGDINTLRIVHAFDPVPFVPRWNFRHAGTSIMKYTRGHAMWRYQKTAFTLD